VCPFFSLSFLFFFVSRSRAADKRIDAVVGQATENVNSFKKGREEYLTKIEKLIEEIKTLK